VVVLVHMVVSATTAYGFHRDEFLYLAMGRHLRPWTMDFPPFIAIASKAMLATIGGSLMAVRLLPAIVAGCLILLAGLIARRLGGGGYARFTAALAVALAPLFLRAGTLFQPVIFDQLWWTLALYALIRIAELRPSATDDARRAWLLLGLFLGLGLLTKFSIGFIGVGIVIGILLTASRRWLLTPWPWLAVLLTVAIGSPSIVGQIRLDFPVVGQMRDLEMSQLSHVTPFAFLRGQAFMLGPAVLLAMMGVVQLIRSRFRIAGWTILATVLLLLVMGGKPYYAGPVYPTLFAAGAVWLEELAVARRSSLARWTWKVVPILVIAACGAIALPQGLPILPPARMIAWDHRFGMTETTNQGEIIALPQDYADMLGWEAQVKATAAVYHALTPAERAEVVVFAPNYGRAGANDQLGPALGLPPAVSPVGSYWFFGPGTRPGRTMIVIGESRKELEPYFDSVSAGARIVDSLRVPEERDVTIWVGRGGRYRLQDVWGRWKGEN
jgi:hypothetical protein